MVSAWPTFKAFGDLAALPFGFNGPGIGLNSAVSIPRDLGSRLKKNALLTQFRPLLWCARHFETFGGSRWAKRAQMGKTLRPHLPQPILTQATLARVQVRTGAEVQVSTLTCGNHNRCRWNRSEWNVALRSPRYSPIQCPLEMRIPGRIWGDARHSGVPFFTTVLLRLDWQFLVPE